MAPVGEDLDDNHGFIACRLTVEFRVTLNLHKPAPWTLIKDFPLLSYTESQGLSTHPTRISKRYSLHFVPYSN